MALVFSLNIKWCRIEQRLEFADDGKAWRKAIFDEVYTIFREVSEEMGLEDNFRKSKYILSSRREDK